MHNLELIVVLMFSTKLLFVTWIVSEYANKLYIKILCAMIWLFIYFVLVQFRKLGSHINHLNKQITEYKQKEKMEKYEHLKQDIFAKSSPKRNSKEYIYDNVNKSENSPEQNVKKN